MHVNSLSFVSETPLTVWWVLSSRDGEGRSIGQQVVKTVGFDPLVYSGSLIPYGGAEVPEQFVVERAAGGHGPIRVLSLPPSGWDHRVMLLSARVREMKEKEGIWLPGTDGRPDPFAPPKRIVTTDDRLRAIEAVLGRVDAKLDRVLQILKP